VNKIIKQEIKALAELHKLTPFVLSPLNSTYDTSFDIGIKKAAFSKNES
jgi:hypothetical protein